MLNLKKSLKLAGVLAIALGAAAPVMTTAASAAPVTQHQMVRVAQNDRFDSHRDFRGHEHRGFEHGRWHRHHAFRHHHWR